MKNKIDQIGKTLKESLLEQVSDNNQQIEEKLKQVLCQTKTYADSVKGNQTTEGSYPKPAEKVNFRIIMKEAKNDELAEESDKKLRTCNIILHRVKEASNDNKEEAKMIDETVVTEFIDAVGIQATFKVIVRIGKADFTKRRPIKLVMNSEEDKKKCRT